LKIAYRKRPSAACVAIILRAGDFYGSGRGSWFDLVVAKEASGGRVTYPGPLDVLHEWAYLPDFASALLRLATSVKRSQRSRASTFPATPSPAAN